MKNTILTLAGIIVLGTASLMADGSLVQVVDTTVVAEVSDSVIYDSTVGLTVKTDESAVQVVGSTVVAEISDSYVESSTIGIDVDDLED